MIRANPIVDKTFGFALEVIRVCEQMENHRKFVVANQLLKSGTSTGAQVREAQNAESKADFIHKFKIAAKETEYWLLLIQSGYKIDVESLLQNLLEIKKIVSKIIITSKTK
jgi:four helix bundle protein